ncbi:MAG: RHS repeat-associated core domain-containing protein [Pseudomonadota bacterium]
MKKVLQKTALMIATSLVVILSAPTWEPQSRAFAVPSVPDMANRIEQLSGIPAGQIDGLYAVEQRAELVFVDFEIVIPVVRTPAAYYLLVRDSVTGDWLRVLVDAAEWRNDFRPYFESVGVQIHKQPPGTFEGLTAAAEADLLAPNDISAVTNANLAIYGSVVGAAGAPEVAPQPFDAPFPDPASSTDSDKVGITAGSIRVNESGAATYSIPLSLPTGTAGVAPSISISYSSAAGNGLLGLGWSLAGLSELSRCRATLGQDGTPAPITFTNADKFCLDGQRLLLVAGTHAQVGATYRTEIDSNAIVEITQVANGEPDTFTVMRSDGSTSYFGRGPLGDASNEAKLSVAAGKTVSWSIRTFMDSVGNPIWFDYQSSNTEQQISKIRYAFTASERTSATAAGHAQIDFVYEDRDDKRRSFVRGHELVRTKRLKRVDVKNKTGGTLELVREYRLDYGQSYAFENGELVGINLPLQDKLSRLVDVTECVGSVCLTPTHFEWARPMEEAVSFYLGGQITWEGRSRFIEPQSHNVSLLNNDHKLAAYRAADVNGDGQTDFVWVEAAYGSDPLDYTPRLNYALKVGENIEQGTFVGGNTCTGANDKEVCLVKVPSTDSVKLSVLDFNADGRSDAALYDRVAAKWNIYLSKPQSDGSWKLSSVPVVSPAVDGQLSDFDAQFIDLNSDGLLDYVRIGIGGISVSYLEPDPAAATSSSEFYKFAAAQPLVSDTPLFSNEVAIWGPKYDELKLAGGGADFNGDGRADFILFGEIDNNCHDENDPSITCPAVQSIKQLVTMTGDYSFDRYADLGPLDQSYRVQAVDLNGDGLTDIVSSTHASQSNTDNLYYMFNEGDGTFSNPVFFNEATLGKSPAAETDPLENKPGADEPQFYDWNYDGYLDLVWKTVVTDPGTDPGLNIRYWDPKDGVFAPTTPSGIPGISGHPDVSVFAADMDGSGALKVVSFSGEAGQISVIDRPGLPLNKVTDIIDGFGARTTIEYETLAQTDRYDAVELSSTSTPVQGVFCEPDSDPLHEEICSFYDYYIADFGVFYEKLNSDWDLPAGSQGISRYQPVLEYSAPTYVVTSLESSAPALVTDQQGNYSVDNDAVSRISYHYAEAKLQAAGRGMLGFQQLRSVDEQSGIVTTTRYRQDWPFIGYPISTETRTSQGNLLSKSETKYEMLEYGALTSQFSGQTLADAAEASGTAVLGPLQLVTVESESYGYDFVQDGAQQGALLTHSKTETTAFDTEANPQTIVVTDYDATGSVLRTVTSTNSYFSDTVFPLIWARLQTATVDTVRTGYTGPGDTQKQSAFTYYTTSNKLGLLESEMVTIPSDTSLNVTTTHDYNALGVRHSSMVSTAEGNRCAASGGVGQVVAEYDDTGRYVDVTRDCLGRDTSRVIGRNKFGEPTTVHTYVDVNSSAGHITTEVAYGAMGREYFRKTSTGGATYSYLDTNTTNCPAGTVYRELNSSTDGSETMTCFDKLGRSTRELARGFSGAWVASDTQYDSSSRKERYSEPYFLSSGASHWTKATFDRLGRPTSMLLPDGSSGSTVYSGYTVQTINDLGQSRVEHSDPLGDLVMVVDNLGGQTSYSYDHHGNMVTMTDNAGNTTTIGYDIFGQKRTMDDPDKGVWSYDYSAFGDLVSQTNANGHSTKMTYDDLGRMTTRLDCINTAAAQCDANAMLEGSTTWTYDTGANALGQLVSVEDTISGYYQAVAYDGFGRSSEVSTNFDGTLYKEKTTYDEYGRVFQVFDAAGDGTWTDSGIRNRYNSYGFLFSVEDAVQVAGASRTVYRSITEMDARAQVKAEVLGNDVITSRGYDAATGRLKAITSTGAAVNIQDLDYHWDTVGNLNWRRDQSAGKDITETFQYDGLNRLKQQAVAGETPVNVMYDAAHIGNIINKSDVGAYTYGTAGPHAATDIDGDVFTYDANGNNLSGDGRQLKYTTFDKPYEITKGTDQVNFFYGPSRSRYKREDISSSGTKVTRYIGSVEIISMPNGNEVRKRYIAGVAIETSTYQNFGQALIDKQTVYTHKDHLGSMDVITNEFGQVVQTMSFDAWGQRRNGNWQILPAVQAIGFDSSVTTRGFTGHEMIDSMGIIHMNGRIYDQRIGRFLQADPIIQDPTNGQSLNRYSYVWNNPLNATDPSGYLVSHLLVQAFYRVLPAELHGPVNAVLNIAVASVCPACVTLTATYTTAQSTYALTGDFSTAIRAGAFAGISAAAFNAVGRGFSEGAFSTLNGPSRAIAQVALHGFTGGVLAAIQGGNFGHGFISNAFGKAATIASLGLDVGPRFIIASVAGGTASELAGGKFSNGAATAAMAFIANEVATGGDADEEEAQKIDRSFLDKKGARAAIDKGLRLARQASFNKEATDRALDINSQHDPDKLRQAGALIELRKFWRPFRLRPMVTESEVGHRVALGAFHTAKSWHRNSTNMGAKVRISSGFAVAIWVPPRPGFDFSKLQRNFSHVPDLPLIVEYQGNRYLLNAVSPPEPY